MVLDDLIDKQSDCMGSFLIICRKLASALLILGWISLLCFDLVEDLDKIPAQASVSRSSTDNSNSRLWGWGPLLNNIVEFATFTEQPDLSLVSLTPIVLNPDPTLGFPVHIHLHQLYLIFLI